MPASARNDPGGHGAAARAVSGGWGLAGIIVAVALLAVAPGPQRALLLLGVVTTFWQPLQTIVGAWGGGMPGTRGGQLRAITVNTAGMVAGAGLLTIGAQVLAGRLDWYGLATTDTVRAGRPVFATFPVLIPLAALLFVAFLQVTMICEQQPFARLGRPWGGWAALGSVAVISIVAYFLLVNWDAVPAATRAATGLRNPGGPIAGADLPTWLIVVAGWQVIVTNLLQAWPGSLTGSRTARIAVNNVVVVGGATASLYALQDAGLSAATIAALGGCTVAGGRMAAVLFGGWPQPPGQQSRLVLAAQGAACTAALFAVLTAVSHASRFDRQPGGLWVAVVALNLISGGITFDTDVLGSPCPGRWRPATKHTAGPAADTAETPGHHQAPIKGKRSRT